MSMSYDNFNGTKQKEIKVGKGETIKIKADIVTEGGELDVEIENQDTDEDAYSGDDLPTSTFEVTLDKEGTYIIKVDADNHKGSYSFTW